MTLKSKIDALKQAASDPMSRDPTSPFQQFRQKKMDKRLEDLLGRGVQANTPQTPQADYHLTKYIEKGIKVRPQKPGIKQYNKMVSAQENKEKLRQMFAEEDTADEIIKRHRADTSKRPEGYIQLDKAYDAFVPEHAKEIRRQIGTKGKKLGLIGTTTRGTPEETKPDLERVKKQFGSSYLGGYKGKVEASYKVDFDKDEELEKHLGNIQESALVIDENNVARLVKNKKYKTKGAQEHETTIELEPTAQPLQVVFQGKRYAHMGKLDIGSLNYDEVDPIKDMNSISIGLINESESELTRFALETNMPKDAYKIDFPYKIAVQGKAIATLFLMGSKINKMSKDEPIRLKFTYKENEL